MWTKCFAVCLTFLAGSASSASVVQTTHGPLEGTTLTLYDGKKVEAFLGVPYAVPPVGPNRFAPPQPLPPWKESGTLRATNLSKSCVQSATERMRKNAWFVSDLPESEDCLYLNVWRPQGTGGKLPVMIFVHGGGWMGGTASWSVYDGRILAGRNDVVVASFNYRIGMLGFLYLNNSEVPGNAGLQDQIQAVRWILDNIEAFGGDPDRVTLFGHSVGSLSVSYHMVNPKVRPWFRNAIVFSGPANEPLVTASESQALETSLNLARKVSCPTEDVEETLACLRRAEASELIGTLESFFTNGQITYCPVRNNVEVPSDVTDVSKLVPPSERKTIIEGNVPREFIFMTTEFLPGKLLTEDLTVSDQEYRDVLKNLFRLSDGRLQDVVAHEYMRYDGSYNASNMRIETLSAISDYAMFCPELAFTKQWMSDENKVYYFFFNHRPSVPLRFPIPEWAGPIHGDELRFMFGAPLDPKNGYTEEEKSMSEAMMKYWTCFARTGDPNGASPRGVIWPPLKQNGKFTHVEFRNGVTIKDSLGEADRVCDFWDKVYPNLLSIQENLDSQKQKT